MRKEEKEEFLHKLWNTIYKRGIPINVRNGAISDIATWAEDVADDCIQIDEPLGTEIVQGQDKCPVCKRSVGMSGFFCKWCGAMLREKLY